MASAPSVYGVFKSACSRTRSKCAVETEYSHENLAAFISAHLQGWRVIEPKEGVNAPSNFPVVEPEPLLTKAKETLAALIGCPIDETEDKINGHCETCAVVLTEKVIAALRKGETDPLEKGFADLAQELQDAGVERQVQILFEPERRAAQSKLKRQYAMWAPCLLGADEIVLNEIVNGKDVHYHHALTAGFPDVGPLIQRVAKTCQEAEDPIAVLPIYILNYIWDCDELAEEDMQQTVHETAQYSLHVAGLVLDGKTHHAYIADPNGPLMKGGSMEFLALPVKNLPRHVIPSTSNSRFDRVERKNAEAAEKAAKKKTEKRKASTNKGKGKSKKTKAKK